MTDPIADMIIRIKNALLAGRPEVRIPHSKLKVSIAKLLVDHGYIDSFEVTDVVPQPEIVVKAKYVGRTPAITEVRRISKPGRRVYATARRIPRALGGYGLTIVSTSKGLVSDREARKQNLGGEVICQIW